MPIPAGYVLLAMVWYFVWSFVVNDMFKVSILERFKADHRYQ
jgi:hypothetical protein